jgi:hypothetical protein
LAGFGGLWCSLLQRFDQPERDESGLVEQLRVILRVGQRHLGNWQRLNESLDPETGRGEFGADLGQRLPPVADLPATLPGLFDDFGVKVTATVATPVGQRVMGGDDQAPERTQDPAYFAQRADPVIHVVDDQRHDRQVEGAVAGPVDPLA